MHNCKQYGGGREVIIPIAHRKQTTGAPLLREFGSPGSVEPSDSPCHTYRCTVVQGVRVAEDESAEA